MSAKVSAPVQLPETVVDVLDDVVLLEVGDELLELEELVVEDVELLEEDVLLDVDVQVTTTLFTAVGATMLPSGKP